MIPFVIRSMIQHGDPPHHLIGFLRDKELRRRMPIEGMLLSIEHAFGIGLKRRHPLRHVTIQVKGEIEEPFHLATVGGVNLDDIHLSSTSVDQSLLDCRSIGQVWATEMCYYDNGGANFCQEDNHASARVSR